MSLGEGFQEKGASKKKVPATKTGQPAGVSRFGGRRLFLMKPGFDYNRGMIRTVEAIVDEKGQVRLSEPLQLSRSQRALVTILDEEPLPQLHENSLLSERALAEDWNRPEEDAAWSHLGEVR